MDLRLMPSRSRSESGMRPIIVKYTLNEHERNLFAVKYHLELPTVEELRLELNRERAAIEEALAIRK